MQRVARDSRRHHALALDIDKALRRARRRARHDTFPAPRRWDEKTGQAKQRAWHSARQFAQPYVALIAHAEDAFPCVLAAHVHCSMLLLHNLRSQVVGTAMHQACLTKCSNQVVAAIADTWTQHACMRQRSLAATGKADSVSNPLELGTAPPSDKPQSCDTDTK